MNTNTQKAHAYTMALTINALTGNNNTPADIFQKCEECRGHLTEADTHATLCRWCEFYAIYRKATR